MPGSARLLAILCVASVLPPAGCGPKNFANENDSLRATVMDQQREIGALKLRNAELEAELEAAGAAPDGIREEVHANTPQVAKIEIGRRSAARDADGDGAIDTVTVHVKPSDGRGRFLQLVGDLAVHVALLPADREAITIGRVTLPPGELRDAYRSTFAGTHYTIDVPVTMPADLNGPGACQAHVVFTDGRTGRVYEGSRAIKLPIGP
jgi:hypothetical protein